MEPIPFRAVLITAGVLSRDGRIVDPGALFWTTPMTLQVQLEDGHGGEAGPTQIAGRIDTITQQGNDYIGEGFLTTDCGIYQVAPMVADLTLNGISVDLAPKVVEYRANPTEQAEDAPAQQTPEEAANPVPEVDEAEPTLRMSIEDVIEAVVEGEIIAATICAKPAMANAYIELATEPIAPTEPADAAPDAVPAPDAAPAAPVAASAGFPRVWRVTSPFSLTAAPAPPPAAQPDNSGGAMIALYPPEAGDLAVDGGLGADELHITICYLGDAAALDPDTITELQSICTEIATGLESGMGTIAGPASFVNTDADPDDPDASNVPLVALIDSDWVTDLYANVDDALDASGIDSPSEHGFIPHMTLRYAQAPELLDLSPVDLSFPSIWLVIGGDATEYPCGSALTASAAGVAPEAPPAAWFDDPKLDGPVPMTVTPEGRVYGHLATWGTCHTSYAGQCVRPPRSRSGYAYYNSAQLLTAEGELVDVGPITLDTDHAPMSASRQAAKAHYDNTGVAVADVRMGEDKHGIWMAGAVRPDVAAQAVRRLRGARVSGDWRAAGGCLELVGALACNIAGFPVPRTQARVASGQLVSLTTAEFDEPDLEQDIDALVAIAEHGDRVLDVIAASGGIS